MGKLFVHFRVGTPNTLEKAVPLEQQGKTLSLWVHSERMTGARVTVPFLAPDEANRFEIPFAMEWTGWNHM